MYNCQFCLKAEPFDACCVDHERTRATGHMWRKDHLQVSHHCRSTTTTTGPVLLDITIVVVVIVVICVAAVALLLFGGGFSSFDGRLHSGRRGVVAPRRTREQKACVDTVRPGQAQRWNDLRCRRHHQRGRGGRRRWPQIVCHLARQRKRCKMARFLDVCLCVSLFILRYLVDNDNDQLELISKQFETSGVVEEHSRLLSSTPSTILETQQCSDGINDEKPHVAVLHH